MDFSKLSLEQIEALDTELIEKLSFAEFEALYKRCTELGRGYLFGGKIESGESFYGRDIISLEKNSSGEWQIMEWASGPTYIKKPKIVDEKTFVAEMLKLGVAQELLDKFLKHEVNWDDW